ncbi:efflux RND transporter periplasmic adaptor subunit, partial [Candidatus Deferrimicrobium sp.]|uniref:efflux RND transporter periplasmic adaptor subunit n=1 Tax=Candidatus Deferrimicrobium sp. TaxID=3060586 RepID=UPI003C4DBFBC
PPDTVTTFMARSESWDTSLSAVGSLTAVQGVTVAAEMPAKVVEIAFEPGTKVKRGDRLIRQDTSVEEAQLPGAEAQVTLTQSVLARDAEMLKEKIVSQADYDTAVAGHRQAMAQVETLRATIAKKTIRAPFGGRLGVRQVNLGQTLREGDPIVTLQSLDPIYVNFALPQQELSRLHVGLPVRVTSDAFPGAAINGRITTVNPLVDADTRNVQLQASVANPEETLRPGMYVTTAVGLPVRKKVVAIPATSVLYAPFGDSVFVVDEKAGTGGKAVRQQFVRLGEKRGDFIAVTDGLKEGETIVSTGVFKLRNGQPVVVDNKLSPSYRLAPQPKND